MTLSAPQERFLALHADHVVTRWIWLFQETQLRAWSGKRSATISAAEMQDLLARDLMEQGHGYADVRITTAGRAAAEKKELVDERT